MSIGIGVGDIIKLLELVIKARKQFVNAPAEYQDIATDLKGFSHVVQDIDVLLSGSELSPDLRRRIEAIKDKSLDLMNRLLALLERKKCVEFHSTSATHAVQKAWKRIQWDQGEVDDFRRQISVNLNLLSRVMSELESERVQRIEQGVRTLVDESGRRKQNEIFKWMRAADQTERQTHQLEKHESGSGQWFLECDKFQQWIGAKEQTLLCTGHPGAGKSVLASIVVRHLQDRFKNEKRIGVAYYYCYFKHQAEEKLDVILATILEQLTRPLGFLPDELSTLYSTHQERSIRPSITDMTRILESVISRHSRVFIVVDGLDECLEWRRILPKIRGLPGVNVLFTSRAIPDIVDDEMFEGSSVCEIQATEADIRRYLIHNVPRGGKLGKLLKDNQLLQSEICNTISSSVGGIFLLAHLHLESLRNKTCVRSLKRALKALPTGSSAYDEHYEAAMKRIESQHPDRKVVAKDILGWIVFARRPLCVAELRTAVAIEETDTMIDVDCLTDIDELVSACVGLVAVDKHSETVTLIHYTTQEYLERTQDNWRPDPHALIAKSCLTYLLFPVFDVEISDPLGGVLDSDYRNHQKKTRELYPLLEYCREYGALHARQSKSKPSVFGRFLTSKSKVGKNWMILSAKYGGLSAEATVEWLIEGGVCIETRDAGQRSVLHYAVLNNWKQCVRLLLERGAGMQPDIENMTPFHYTVKTKNEEMAQVFLDNGTPIDLAVTREFNHPSPRHGRILYKMREDAQDPVREASNGVGLTALHLSAWVGSLQMTKFLLDHGARPDPLSDNGETPLHLALAKKLYGPEWPGFVDFWSDPESRIECLLDLVEFDDEDRNEYLTTCDWIEEQRETIINLLLEHPEDVGVCAQDSFGMSPLHNAVCGRYSYESMIAKLVDRGARTSTRTIRGETPLHLAIQHEKVDAVASLLALGANPLDCDIDGLNALHHAARQGHLEVLRSIVSHVTETTAEMLFLSTDNYNRNVLHHLMRNPFFVDSTAVSFLLQWRVGINDLDTAGRSPTAEYLSSFALCGTEKGPAVLDLLFTNRADPTFKTEDGLSLAHLAARSHKLSVPLLQMLIKWNVDPTALDRQWKSALHHSAVRGTLTKAVLHYLCMDLGLSVGLLDAHGKTPLDYASEKRQEVHDEDMFGSDDWARSEQLLLEFGGNPC